VSASINISVSVATHKAEVEEAVSIDKTVISNLRQTGTFLALEQTRARAPQRFASFCFNLFFFALVSFCFALFCSHISDNHTRTPPILSPTHARSAIHTPFCAGKSSWPSVRRPGHSEPARALQAIGVFVPVQWNSVAVGVVVSGGGSTAKARPCSTSTLMMTVPKMSGVARWTAAFEHMNKQR
jgi:hypothetical protein